MAKIYTAPRDEKTYLSLADKKLNSGDYLGALLITDTIKSLPSYDRLNLYALRARIYYKMKQYARSAEEWFNYLANTKNEKFYGRAYNGLGACFYKMQDINVAGYYFNRQIVSNKKAIYEYSEVTAEFYQDVLSTDKNYYLAYPFDKADFTNLLEKAEDLLRASEYDECLSLLKNVPENSKFYATALISSSIAKYFKGDISGAVEDIEKSVALEVKPVSVCNAISMFHSLKNEEKVSYYVEILKTLDISIEEDIYKVSMVYAEKGLHQTAVSFAEKYLKLNPYDTSMLLIYGIMNCNLKNYDRAEYAFSKAYKINRSYIAKNYLDKLSDIGENLEYSFDLPINDRVALVKRLGELMREGSAERLDNEEEIYRISNYVFYSSAYQMQSSILTILGELATEKSVEIMKKMLLSLNVFDRVKSGVIGFLVASNVEGEISACFGNIFRKITLYSADIEGKDFIEAYAYLIAKLAPVEKDLMPLKLSAENLYQKAKSLKLNEIEKVKALSAVMYELSSISKIKSRRDFAKFFDASLKDIKKLKEIFQN